MKAQALDRRKSESRKGGAEAWKKVNSLFGIVLSEVKVNEFN